MADSLHFIASDLSQQVLELRRLRGELGPQALDSQNRRLYAVPCAVVQREGFIADREVAIDHAQGRLVESRHVCK